MRRLKVWEIMIVIVAIGAIGALTGFMVSRAEDFAGGWTGLVLLAGFGALFGGATAVWAFGHAGPLGWLRALAGALLATAMGAAIPGGLLLPLDGAVIAALFVFSAIVTHPDVLLIWLAGMAGLHLWVRSRRQTLQSGEQIVS